MAEFPHLGRHCDAAYCNQLDFLPIKCDSCQGYYCTQHFVYDAHSCPQSHRKNIQVPICPVCSQPVPTPKGFSVDAQINEHIQNNCEKVKKKEIYKNRCSVKGCRKKELVPVTCPTCQQNYCLTHRHEKDHNCEEKARIKDDGYFSNAMPVFSRARNSFSCSSQARNAQIISDEQLARSLQQEEYENSDRQTSNGRTRNGCIVS